MPGRGVEAELAGLSGDVGVQVDVKTHRRLAVPGKPRYGCDKCLRTAVVHELGKHFCKEHAPAELDGP